MKHITDFIRSTFHEPTEFIPLHDPRFIGNERKYLNDALSTNFVSSVGEYVVKFEKMCAAYTGAKYAVATMNGTAALHIALLLAGVSENDEVITQSLTFVATTNAINYTGAKCVFLDVDKDTMGLSPEKLSAFLKNNTFSKDGKTYNSTTKRRIAAVVPMHTFGHPCRIDEIAQICETYNIELIEDAAESVGSFYKGKHTGLFGKMGILSFNGNKIITTGGGGMILTDDEDLAKKAKHITTTGKIPHPWEFNHDIVAYNYRLTNLAAALGCGQIEQLEFFVEEKRKLAEKYDAFFAKETDIMFVNEPQESRSNYWLQAIILQDRSARDAFLEYTNQNGVMTRPIWTLMNKLDMYKDCQTDDLSNSLWLEDRVVNIPSSVFVKNYYHDLQKIF